MRNLIERGIDRLVVIGGDGSLSGARPAPRGVAGAASPSWSPTARSTRTRRPRIRALMIVGLVGSIDNDMFGTDMTIGADTALHRIVEAIDAIASTAASHQRTFVVEVMGRNCGYLALMSAIAERRRLACSSRRARRDAGLGGADVRGAARPAGRTAGATASCSSPRARATARATRSPPTTSGSVLEDRLGEDTRVTILGHVQRGGAPSAFDRYMGTLLGHAAVERLLADARDAPPQLSGCAATGSSARR